MFRRDRASIVAAVVVRKNDLGNPTSRVCFVGSSSQNAAAADSAFAISN
jgi:hypothetical protein